MNTEEVRLKSIDTALEWTKQIITISTGVLVLSGGFIKDLFHGKVQSPGFLVSCWLGLCLSILFGLLFMGSLCSILARNKPSEVNIYSQPAITLGLLHFSSFFVALVLFAIFAVQNVLRA